VKVPTDPLAFLNDELEGLDRAGLLRQPAAGHASANDECVVLCSNDYLGFAAEPWPAAANEPRSGAGASRLIAGQHPQHAAAEDALAAWVGAEAALLFSSGYAANVGVLSALAGRGDLIVSDALNHASIIDGCRLSGAEVAIVPHLDAPAAAAALERGTRARRTFLVTESYFSMEGDSPDLVQLRDICYKFGASLVVDEAHALGVFGDRGAGLCSMVDVRPDVLIGTLGKAVGLQGAFVAGSSQLRTWIWNRARSFVFSTGVLPALAGVLPSRVDRVMRADGARVRLRAVVDRLRAELALCGASLLGRIDGPILPWVVGDPRRALELSERLRARHVLVTAIRPPTVPAGTSRLRIAAAAHLTERDLECALRALRAVTWGGG
jgi:8-amino-7-oxononanoate synthase